MNDDIHIYWKNDIEKSEAFKLRQLLIENQAQTFTPVEKPIGPHPFPMFEAHASWVQLPEIERLLITNRHNCSILTHEKTGNHMYDHTKGARWLGDVLELNSEFLRNFTG